jgi:hypothetical protein
MTFRSHREAAITAFLAAVLLVACAWHFAWRQAAYWSTGEQITDEQMHRAGVLSELFRGAAVVAAITAIVFTTFCVRKRRRSAA